MGKEVNFGKLLHGGDYNPEQWLDYPEAGVRVELDGKLFDGTVKGRLSELSRRISDTVRTAEAGCR